MFDNIGGKDKHAKIKICKYSVSNIFRPLWIVLSFFLLFFFGHICHNFPCIYSFVNLFYTAWSIYRLACQRPGCEDDCPKNIGCFTHDTTTNNRFDIDIQCWDAYGSTVSSTFTMNLQDNTPPSFTAASSYILLRKVSLLINY